MPRRVPSYHAPRIGRAPTRERKDFDKVGNTPFTVWRGWRRFRERYLRNHPLCADCSARGEVTLASDVHHKVKRADRPDLALDESNCLALCHSCHSQRTARGE